MRLVLLGHADPDDEGFWSGIPMHIAASLRSAGHEVCTIGPLEPDVTLWGRLKGRFYRHALGRNYSINRDPALFKARAIQANRLLQDQTGADAIIVPFPPDAAYLNCAPPIILVHDATWYQLLDFYPGYERSNLSRETIKGGLELDRRALAVCDRAIYSSHWAANSARRDYGIDPVKLHVIPFGAGLTAVPSRDDIARYLAERQHGPCRLLFMGVDWHRKGGDIALAAASKLHDDGLSVELQVVGCEPPSGVPSFVRRFGFLSKKDPRQASLIHMLFQQASFFIMPTRADCTPVVFGEAAAYGLPVLTTNVGGISEIFGTGDWGSMFPLTVSPDEYARRIRACYESRGEYQRMAWAARQEFEDRLNWSTFCRGLLAVVDMAKLGPARTGTHRRR